MIADLPKKVDWDQAELGHDGRAHPRRGDDPTEYVETIFRVSERKYAAWPAAIRTALRGGRAR